MRRFLVIAVVVLALIGGGVAWKVAADRTAAEPRDVTPADPSSFILPGDYQPTEDEQAWIDSHTSTTGVYAKEFGEYLLVLVTMGEKPTGGYAVEIAQVGLAGDTWVVDVHYVSPGPNDIVIQVLTYPYGFVKIRDEGKSLEVRDTSGEEPVSLAVTHE